MVIWALIQGFGNYVQRQNRKIWLLYFWPNYFPKMDHNLLGKKKMHNSKSPVNPEVFVAFNQNLNPVSYNAHQII